jgi:hypothetical protein
VIRVALCTPSPIEGTSALSRSRRSYFDFFAGALVFVDFFAGAVFSVAFAAFLAVAILELLKQGLPMSVTNSSGKPEMEELALPVIQPTYAQFRQVNLIVLRNLSRRRQEKAKQRLETRRTGARLTPPSCHADDLAARPLRATVSRQLPCQS